MVAFTDKRFWTTLFNRRMLVCLFTGFASGLPLYILIQQVPAWLRVEGIDLKTIGLFALIGFPYTWKFIWAPLMDRYTLPLLGRRRGWMLVTQIALVLLIASLSLVKPAESLSLLLVLVGGIAFFSASQDIVLDAYRRELLSDDELGVGNSYFINAYKISSLVPGSLALILADYMPWSTVNMIVAAFMLVGVLTTLVCDEPEHSGKAPDNLLDAIVEPFVEFFSKSRNLSKAGAILLFMMLYKLGDNMAVALETPFFIDMGYSLTEIGAVAKACKLWAAVVGSIIGGVMMIKLGINRALWVFGVAQIVSILGYAWLASLQGQDSFVLFGTSMSMLVPLGAAVSLEYLGVGLGQVALIAFMARLCNTEFTATQFALLSSLAAVPRTLASASTGFLIEAMGYEKFFLLCFACAIPGMLMLFIVAPWNESSD
ncbi:MAG: AmpG family muropeptide MFS transporter [Pseudomonadota bacterium]